jgi:peptidoglycan-associated lipoprotein
MTKTLRNLTTLALLATVALVVSSGCKKKAPTTTQDARPPVTAKPSTDTQVAPPPSSTTSRDVTSDVIKLPLEELNKKGYLTDAYFDYDQSDLREDARTALASDAEWLKKYPTVQILIEGYCDERGTGNYNLALGDRRANAAKEYLVSLGIDGSRIKTVSYGEERPFCTESNEGCWQQNRRAHLVITAK